MKVNENSNLDKLLTKFWERELKEGQEYEDTICEEFYTKTTRRTTRGRFVGRFPFVKDKKLGRSKHIVVSNFFQFERKFRKNPE